MSALSKMLPEDAEQVVRLPFMVGVWISHAEDEDGALDDTRERAALVEILKNVAADSDRPTFVREVASESLRVFEKQDWDQFSLFSMPDPTRALKILNDNVPSSDAKAFRTMVVEVAEAVACAHGEFGKSEGREAEAGFAGLVDRIMNRVKASDEKGALNISAAEADALDALREALRDPGD